MTFEETYLNDNILDALYDMHFEDMTPIQDILTSAIFR